MTEEEKRETGESENRDKESNGRPDIIDPHGGYRNLKSYQTAEIIYDATVVFCDRFIGRRSRTHDQMVQAARSGRKNCTERARQKEGVN